MIGLIVAILFGLSITFFAFQNSARVPINFGAYQFTDIPVYLAVMVGVLAGVLMGWVISALDGLSHFMTMRGKDRTIHTDQKAIHDLQEKNDRLAEENTRLKAENKEVAYSTPEYRKEEDYRYKPSIFERIFPRSTRHYTKQV